MGLRRDFNDFARRVVAGFKPGEVFRLAVLLAVVLWVAFAINVSTRGLTDRAGQLKGADFLQFYVLGHLAATRDAETLYDAGAYATETRRLVPETVETFPPVYPPQVSVLFEPLSHLSYGWAVIVWTLISVSLYAAVCVIAWRWCPALRARGQLVFWLAVGSQAFFNLVSHGQTSSVAAALLVAMLSALWAGQPVLAGVALGLLAYKPQVGIAAAVVFALSRDWRVLLGATVGAAAELVLGWVHYGTPAMTAYLGILLNPIELTMIVEQKLHHSHSLRTLWALLVPWRPAALTAYALSSAWVLYRTLQHWRRAESSRLCHATLLMATVLIAPHLFVYDLVILAPAFLILADWSLARDEHPASPAVRVLLVAAFLSPLIGPLAAVTRFQASVPILVVLFALATRLDSGSGTRGDMVAGMERA